MGEDKSCGEHCTHLLEFVENLCFRVAWTDGGNVDAIGFGRALLPRTMLLRGSADGAGAEVVETAAGETPSVSTE